MKKFIALWILLFVSASFFVSASVFAETTSQNNQLSDQDIIQKTEKINSLLQYYSTLSPFSDEPDRFEVIDSVRADTITLLLDVLNDKRILGYDIDELITEDELLISKSPDNRIYFLSISEKTGGTYRTSETIIHYRPTDEVVKAELFAGEASQALATSTYSQLYLIDDSAQKYFVIGGVSTCNTCSVMLAVVLEIGADSIQTDLVTQYDGRRYDLETFEYDAESKTFDVVYYSASDSDPLYGEDHGMDGFRRKYQQTFKYVNRDFLETETCMRWIPIK